MSSLFQGRLIGIAFVVSILIGCRDNVVDPTFPAARPVATLECSVNVQARDLTCRGESLDLPAGIQSAIFGQAQVKLASSNVAYDTTNLLFTADITVQNLLAETLGTPDGETVTGVHVFFQDGPRATSYVVPFDTGSVTIQNADGRSRLTQENQPFFLYDTALEPGETSGARTWEWLIPRSVSTFAFTLKVSALTPGELLQPRLIVLASEGVNGSPLAGDEIVGAGTDVVYGFAVASGYQNLTVRLDGRPVPDTGTVHLDSIHVLDASADPIVTVPAEYQYLLSLAQAVGTSGDKAVAFQEYAEAAGSLVAAIGLQRAESVLQAVEFLAYDSAPDFETEIAIDRALANHGFTFTNPRQSEAYRTIDSRRTQQSMSDADVSDSTVFVYVNGAYTGGRLANTSREVVARLVQEAHFMTPFAGRILLVYNRTYSTQYDSTQLRRAFCANAYIRNGPLLGPHSRTSRYLTCRGIVVREGIYGNDYVEAARQVVNTMRDASQVAEEDARILADTLENIVEKGQKVVMVAHSQGNLMTQQAVRTLRQRDPSWENGRSLCIGAVAMGAPMSSGWYVREEELAGVSVRGDIILGIPELDLGGWNTFPLSWNSWSDSLEADLDDIGPYRYVPFYRGPLTSRVYMKWAVTIHHPTISYLGESRSASVIQAALTNVHDALARRCGPRPSIMPRGGRVREGETLQLYAPLIVPGRVGGPLTGPVLWTSLDPHAATVDSTGVVRGVRAGSSARIVARRAGVPQADTVSVSVYLDTFDGTWAGTWDNGDLFGQPFTSGPMSLTLAGSGGSIALTYQSGRFDGAIPAYLPEESPFGRAAYVTSQNVGTPAEMRTVYVYFHEDLGQWTQHPYQMRARLQLSGAGTQLVGTLTDCRVESTCLFGFRTVGTITLNRIW